MARLLSGRRRAPWLLGVAALAIAMTLFGPLRAHALDPDPDLQDAVSELGDLVSVFDRLNQINDLADDLPLSGVDPAEVLGLADVFDNPGGAVDSLTERLAGLAPDKFADPDALESALDEIDATAGEVMVRLGGPDTDVDGPGTDIGGDGKPIITKGADGIVDIQLSLRASRTFPVPIQFANGVVDLMSSGGTGTFPIAVELGTSNLHIRFDPDAFSAPATAEQAFQLVTTPTPPAITLSASASAASLIGMEANLGFTLVDIGGSVSFDIDYALIVDDPDTSGEITAQELANTLITDLVHGGLVDDSATNAVDASITADSDLVDGNPDLTITYTDASLTDAITPTPQFDGTADILDFQNFSAEEALGAVARLISMLDGLQATGVLDLDLPLLKGHQDAGSDSPSGTFSDAVKLITELRNAVNEDQTGDDAAPELAAEDDPTTDIDETGNPTFTNAQQLVDVLADALASALGGAITVDYDDVAHRLAFGFDVSGSHSDDVDLNLGDLDILSGIALKTSGVASLSGGYELHLKMGLDLTAQPREDGAGIGSCTDGVDNGPEDDDPATVEDDPPVANDPATPVDESDLRDAVDNDCTTAETLEQRVQVFVGTEATPSPEVEANLGLTARGIDAIARIGLLEAGIDDAELALAGSLGEDGAGPLGATSCHDGLDNDAAGGTDVADADCRATFEVDIVDEVGDGWISIRDAFNAIGRSDGEDIDTEQAGVQEAPQWATAKVDAAFSGKVPVAADLLPDVDPGGELGGGDIVVTGGYTGPVTGAHHLVDSVSVDGSDLETEDLFSFSPCAGSADDDGDGTANDGCPDGPPAVDQPESSTLAMFDKVVDAIRLIAEQLESSGVFPTGTLDQPLPLVGVSFNDIVSFADTLGGAADSLGEAAESAIPGACANTKDDDGDDVPNDGCPTSGGADDLPESLCADGVLADASDPDSDVLGTDDDGDGTVNDGCQPAVPSLQDLADALALMLDRALDGIDDATAILDDVSAADLSASLGYSAAENDLTFTLSGPFTYDLPAPFSFDLPGALSSIVALDLVGDARVNLTAELGLGLGLDFDNLDDPANLAFVRGDTHIDLAANVVGQNLVFEAGVGSLQIQVGEDAADATPESELGAAACDAPDDEDSDGDGFVNDGCPAVPNPETGAACGNKTDDDADGVSDDGCGDDNPDAQDAPEADGACAGSSNGQDDDGDTIVDDGCPDDPPAAAGAGGDREAQADQCEAGDKTDDDADGTVNDGCDAQANQGRFALGAQLELDAGTDGGDDDERYTLGGSNPLSFAGAFTGQDQALCLPLEISGAGASGPVTHEGDPKDGCAVLPLYFDNGTDLEPIGAVPGNNVLIGIVDLPAFISNPTANLSFKYDTSVLQDFIQGALLDLLLLHSGIEDLLALIQGALETDLLSFALPLIGGQTADAAQVVDKIRAGIKGALDAQMAEGGPNPLAATPTANDVKVMVQNLAGAILTSLETATGANLPDPDVRIRCGEASDRACDVGSGEDDADNPAITGGGNPGLCGDSLDNDHDGVVDDGCADIPNAAEGAVNVSDVYFEFAIQGSVNLLDDIPALTFDVGVPGLGLSGGFQPSGTVSWSFLFGFGVSKAEGFYFTTGDHDGNGDPTDDAAEIGLSLDVALSADDPANVTGSFGFLEVKIADQTDQSAADCTFGDADGVDENACHSALGAVFTVDLLDPGASADNKLTFSELSGPVAFSSLVDFGVQAQAEVNLDIATGFPGGAGLPQITGVLRLDWDFAISSSSDPDDLAPAESGPSALTIALEDLNLDVGTYLSKFLKPIFGDVKRFTEPFKPIVDAINACVPVISDLGGECTSLLDIAESFAPQDYQFLVYIARIVSFVAQLPATDGDGTAKIPITVNGSNDFQLQGPTLQEGELAPTEARQAYKSNIDDPTANLLTAMNAQPAVQSAGGEELKADGLGAIGVHLPFLEHPEKLLGLLFGQDVDLIVWEPPAVKIEFSYSQKFGPIWSVPPVFLELGGSVSVTGQFGIGYSTKGLRNAVLNDGGPAALLQGLFLVDKHPLDGGADTNELELRGEIFANAQVSVLIFSAGAGGSVYLTIGIDLQDPNGDGRLEYDEAADVIRRTGNVLCIFNLNGEFGVRIFAFAEVDLFFWSQRWEVTLAQIILFQFKVECEPLPDPVLAHGEGTTLYLHVGTRRYLRDPEEWATPLPYEGNPLQTEQAGDNTPDNSVGFDTTAETLTVTRTTTGVTVAGLGVTQDYPGAWTKVVGDAEDTGVTPDADGANVKDVIALTDGKDGDGVKLPFDIEGDLRGGSGPDELTGGVVKDTLVGNDGSDVLVGRGGPNVIYGDNTDDTGTGADSITAEDGVDELWGGPGADKIQGGRGGDAIVGGEGDDAIDGGRGTPKNPDGGDEIWGDDKANAVSGADTIDASDGNDKVHAGPGRDNVLGGLGNDTIDDAGTNESVCSSDLDGEDDVLIGGPGHDSVSGAAGDDVIVGGNVVAGQADEGDDLLAGGHGCDLIFGDNAERLESGGRNLRTIDPSIGGGELAMSGGDGNDTLFGQVGDDDMAGGNGDDHLYGLAGADDIDGDAGVDHLFGDQDTAGIAGSGQGDDDMVGGADGDFLYGDGGIDVMLGDIGTIGVSRVVTLAGGTGVDYLRGGAGDDRQYGQGAGDEIHGDSGEDTAYGDGDDTTHATDDGQDLIRGGSEDDYLFGNNFADELYGDGGDDRMVGGSPNATSPDTLPAKADGFTDHMFGGTGFDVMAGDNATISVAGFVELLAEASIGEADLMYGESGHDRLYGENGDDDLFGGSSDDHLEGGDDSDDLYGETGQDDLIGGTTETADGADEGDQPDTGDHLWGGTGHDVLAGDNAAIVRFGAVDAWTEDDLLDRPGTDGDVLDVLRRRVILFDVATEGAPSAHVGFSGEDELHGESGHDVLYGQGMDDDLWGGALDDYLEGGHGVDTARGEGGQDDIIGGTGRTTSDAPGTAEDHRLDDADFLYGNDEDDAPASTDDYDVIMGDNATVLRGTPFGTPAIGSAWEENSFNASVKRAVFLYDVATTTHAVSSATNGADVMRGQADDDLMYGQGDGDDMEGAGGDDFMEGNDGADTIIGGVGNDDIIGGTGHINDDPFNEADGRPIGSDGRLDTGEIDLSGGDGFDWIAGDNGVISRVLDADGAWVPDPNGGVLRNRIWLQDVASSTGPAVATTVSGGDGMHGNAHHDVMYGQGNGAGVADLMTGDDGDDYMEGNAGSDEMFGNGDQDDMIGGTGIINNDPPTGTDHRLDAGDTMSGGPHADFQLGDNGKIVRPTDPSTGLWIHFTEYNDTTVRREAARFDVAGEAGTSGGDTMDGNAGDDYQWGQDGADVMHGNDDNDDMYGELGDDAMFGDSGQDAMVGDRGRIVDTKLADDSKRVAFETQGPGFFVYVGLVQGQLDRRVSLTDDGDGAPFPSMGIDTGGMDRMRGGPGHDSMHGAFGDDLMNGDSGGDWMFGDDGADVMWGGKGADPTSPDPADVPTTEDGLGVGGDPANIRGVGDRFVDYLFGAYGGTQRNEVLAADILDYLPRVANPSNGFEGDPPPWFVMTSTDDVDPTNDQYHQGVDWIYGGYNRDVLEGNVGKNGPDFGDRLIDWLGAYNLYTRCNPSYGDDGDIRQHSPSMQNLLLTMAYGSGAGMTPAEVGTPGTSAFRELGLVYPGDKGNNGKAFPTSPGHFNEISCTPGT